MGWNSAYWEGKQERAKKAQQHHIYCKSKFKDEIDYSIANTTIYSKQNIDMNIIGTNSPSKVIVDNIDTVSGLFIYNEGKTAVLNFASYKNPGGGFMQGSGAQEEALCHESTLYEVLSSTKFVEYYNWNNQNKNNALYRNRGLYSPSIIFEKDNAQLSADVITVAAPNRKAYMDYCPTATEEENLMALRSRICFIRAIALAQRVDTLILGAYGCGVFGQDPNVVAKEFKETFKNTGIKTVYAVIDKGGHSREGAYCIFNNIMHRGL